jgi:hypothetical protein
MRFLSLAVASIGMILMSACSVTLEDSCVKLTSGVSYSPPGLPIEIGVNGGELSAKVKGKIVSPIGSFGVESGLASDEKQLRLIVIVGAQQYVYDLKDHAETKTFSVQIDTSESARTTVSVEGCKTIVVRVETQGRVVVSPYGAAAPTRAAPTAARSIPTATRPMLTAVSAAPIDAPDSFLCPDTLPTRLRIGARGYVSSDPVNILCRAPAYGGCPRSDRLNAIGRGARFTVVDGPVCRGGYIWWKVDPDDPRKPTAWTPEATRYEYWISPIN